MEEEKKSETVPEHTGSDMLEHEPTPITVPEKVYKNRYERYKSYFNEKAKAWNKAHPERYREIVYRYRENNFRYGDLVGKIAYINYCRDMGQRRKGIDLFSGGLLSWL